MSDVVCGPCGSTVPVGRFCAVCGRPLEAARDGAFVPVLVAGPPADLSLAAPLAPGSGRLHLSCVDVLPRQAPAPGVLWPPPQADPLPVPSVLGGNALGSSSVGRSVSSRARGAVAVTVLALGVGGWLLLGRGAEHVVTGDLSLAGSSHGSTSLSAGDGCTGSGGYSDITAGAQVVLRDGNGSTLATTVLSAGDFDGVSCVFHFSLRGVRAASFYVLSTGNAARGDQRYSFDEMVNREWAPHLTLGGP